LAFDAFEVGIEMVKALREPIEQMRRRDRDLADQALRAAQSVVLNVAEGQRRIGRDRVRFFAIAAGSAAELHAALRLADALGIVRAASLDAVGALLDREKAMLYRLVHPRA
jgi:four helix bundle protein